MRVHAMRAGALMGGLLFPAWSMADWTLNMTPGVTGTSNEIFSLHMTILWICVVIGVVVFGVMFWSIFAHRKSQGAKPANFHEKSFKTDGLEPFFCEKSRFSATWGPSSGFKNLRGSPKPN